MFEIVGIAGITTLMLAYVPQVIHLGKEHCSAGISRRAWAMWLVGSLLVGTLAVHRGDLVFIALQSSTLTSAAIILYLAQKYRGMVCEAHRATRRASSPRLVDHVVLPSDSQGTALRFRDRVLPDVRRYQGFHEAMVQDPETLGSQTPDAAFTKSFFVPARESSSRAAG